MNSFKINRNDDESALHEAVKRPHLQSIRELLYNTDYDSNKHNKHGKTAAFMCFISLFEKATDLALDDWTKCWTTDEIACFDELLWFTYDSQILENSQANEIFDMIDYCSQYSNVPLRKLYIRLVNYFLSPVNPRHYFAEIILKANLPSDYCLIALLFEKNELLNHANFNKLTSKFIAELFTLFMADDSFFNEYLPEIMRTGWKFNVREQSWAFIAMFSFMKQPSSQPLFTFIKCLIQYDIEFVKLLKKCRFYLSANYGDNFLVSVLVPLSKFVNGPIDLHWTIIPHYKRLKQNKLSYYNFNETENILSDFQFIVKRKSNPTEVVSLKNLSRMSVRKYLFQSYSHYKALSILYSLHIPIELRNFLCYNHCNFKF